MFRGVVAEIGGVRVIAMDTIASVKQADAGHVVVCASHGGTSSSYYGQQYPIRAVFFNDAGVGKENAGILAISIFEGKGIPCGAVSHTSARIGDGLDSWESGILSRVNDTAREKGFQAGVPLKEAVSRFLEGETGEPVKRTSRP